MERCAVFLPHVRRSDYWVLAAENIMNVSDQSLGSFGEEVSTLQAKLQQLGFYIAPSEIKRNYYGPATQQAVLQFQKGNRSLVTGVVDRRTAIAIDAALA